MSNQTRNVFFISDGTGITAETLGHSLLTQFKGVEFKQFRMPFVDSAEKAAKACEQINKAWSESEFRPIVFNTLLNDELNGMIRKTEAMVIDLFDHFLDILEKELKLERAQEVGQAHGMVDYQAYEMRMSATNYALNHDDGVNTHYEDADLILLGVSRSGKTPTCLYMALHYGVNAGNYPLTEEDLEQNRLPKRLQPFRHKLFGLTIDPDRLHQIRSIRRPDSRYAELRQCRLEVAEAENMYRQAGVPMLNTTHTSIEEIASKIMLKLGINRDHY